MADPTVVLTSSDNYIYLYPYDGRKAFVVDPGEGPAVLRALERHDLELTTVLITHHHFDHTAGVPQLKSQTGCEVIGPDDPRIRGLDRVITEDVVLALGTLEVSVLATPGHTRTSICYLSKPTDAGQPSIVWTGDTLFVGGCGRPMECEASVLWQSLVELTALPDDTLVYCGHDYTAENYEFALSVDAKDKATQQRLSQVRRAAAKGKPTVPSTIAEERTTNIFLRSGDPMVKAALGMPGTDPGEVFAELRHRKNLFG